MFDAKMFSARLAQLRIQKNMSARQLSLAIGYNSGYIQNIESGKALPSMVVFWDICRELKITPSEFFDLEDADPAKTRALMEDLKQLNDAERESIHVLVKGVLKHDHSR